LVENAAVTGEYLHQRLVDALGSHPHVGDIRGKGAFWALEYVQDKATKEPFPHEEHIAWRIWQRAFDLGLVVYYSQGCIDGVNGDLNMVGPPLIINREQVDEMVAILAAAVTDVLG
jgi:hypothetical protein